MTNKLREALLQASIALSSATHNDLTEGEAEEYLAVVNTVLTEPLKNCEVGTPEEHFERFNKFCGWYQSDWSGSERKEKCSACPLKEKGLACTGDKNTVPCILYWLLMPYEKGEK